MQELPALKRRASEHWKAKEFRAAADTLNQVLAREPTDAHVWNSHGMCLAALGQLAQATDSFRKADELQPNDPVFQRNFAQSLSDLAKASFGQGRWEEVAGALKRLGNLRRLSFDELAIEADTLFNLGHFEEALPVLQSILDEDPRQIRALMLRALISIQLGAYEEAITDLHRVLALDPGRCAAYWYLAQCRKFRADDLELVGRMEALAKSNRPETLEDATIHFAIGRAYDDLGNFEAAMASFDTANRLSKELSRLEFDRDALQREVDELLHRFHAGYIRAEFPDAIKSIRPVFIVGMPRSGTTLTESILAAHPEVAAGGELMFWQEHAHSAMSNGLAGAQEAGETYLRVLEQIDPTAERVTDKNPYNLRFVGLLAMIFPEARFIHCRRNPVDTCLSFYMTTFRHPPDFSFDKSAIVFAFRQYSRLADRWRALLSEPRWMEMHYEDLVTHPEAEARKLVAHLGLEWDSACLRPERSRRKISTMSHRQAREPINAGSIGRRRRYEPSLGEFKDLIDASSST